MAGAPECKPKTYLVPGDRVTIGFVCGTHAFVGYFPGNRQIKGWVELSRLQKLAPSPRDLAERKRWRLPIEDSPVVRAIYTGDSVAAIKLMDAGHDANVALLHAVRTNQTQVALAALQHGADPNSGKTACDVMAAAASGGNVELVRILIKAGGDVNCNRGRGTTPLMAASIIDRPAIELWRALGWRPNPTPNLVEVVRLLLQSGADVNETNGIESALRKTIAPNNVDVAKCLLEAGADPNNYTVEPEGIAPQTGNTILMEAVSWYSLTRDPTMLRLLLVHKADVNVRNPRAYDARCDGVTKGSSGGCIWGGQTALTQAAANGFSTVVKMLLQYSADPLQPRSDGAMPAAIARHFGHLDIAAAIEEHARRAAKAAPSD